MTNSNTNASIRYLSALLACAVALALALFSVSMDDDKDGYLTRWLSLALQVIPSLIAALIAYAAIYFILEKQGILLDSSPEERAHRIANELTKHQHAFLEEKTQEIAIELFKYQHGKPRMSHGSEHDLSGNWRLQDWRHGHPGDKELAYSEDALIYQDGPFVWGAFSTLQGPIKDGKPSQSRYAFHGDLEGDILTGRWWQIDEKSPWKGVFQFKYIPGNADRDMMEGCWAGFSYNKTRINSGSWEWARPGQPFPSEQRAAERLTQQSDSQPRIRHPLVVLMDSANPDLVYDEATQRRGGTNLNDLTDALKDQSLLLVAETTSPAWSRPQQVLALSPDLIIIHVSCFYSETAPMDPDEKFRSFLRLLAGTETKFIVYSRGLFRDKISAQDRKRWQESLHFLEGETFRDRLTYFQVEGGSDASFRDPKTVHDLQIAVKQLLDLP